MKVKKAPVIRRLVAVSCCLVAGAAGLQAQVPARLTLEACYRLAEKNYPLVNQYALIEKTREYSVANVSRGKLPQIRLGGQASYQSDVTQLPFSVPNVTVPAMSKDQYRVYGEVSEPLTELFTTNKYQKQLVEASSAVAEQKTEVGLYKLKERINQLYFGMLLVDAQLAQCDILQGDIQAGLDKDSVAIANGVALKSSADVLRAEWLKAGQQKTELKAMRKSYADMLSLFIHRPVDATTVLEKPSPVPLVSEINRPELKLFNEQKQVFDAQDKLVRASTLPHFSLFAQGGYGRPALNMLDNDFEFYYMGGVRLSWNLSSLYTIKRNRRLLSLDQNSVDVQKETFLFNTHLTLKQQSGKIDALAELAERDRDIIRLRENIKRSAQTQLQYGTATANDYVTYVHAEDQARQSLVLHEIQLLMTQYHYKTTAGN